MRGWLLAGIALVMLVGVGCDSKSSSAPASSSTDVGTVEVKIDYNGRLANRSFAVPCSSDSNVFSILIRAKNLGEIKVQHTGAKSTAFVTSIDGVENEKAAGDNWVYRVNGKLGNTGSGDFVVRPGDEIEWRFGKYPE